MSGTKTKEYNIDKISTLISTPYAERKTRDGKTLEYGKKSNMTRIIRDYLLNLGHKLPRIQNKTNEERASLYNTLIDKSLTEEQKSSIVNFVNSSLSKMPTGKVDWDAFHKTEDYNELTKTLKFTEALTKIPTEAHDVGNMEDLDYFEADAKKLTEEEMKNMLREKGASTIQKFLKNALAKKKMEQTTKEQSATKQIHTPAPPSPSLSPPGRKTKQIQDIKDMREGATTPPVIASSKHHEPQPAKAREQPLVEPPKEEQKTPGVDTGEKEKIKHFESTVDPERVVQENRLKSRTFSFSGLKNMRGLKYSERLGAKVQLSSYFRNLRNRTADNLEDIGTNTDNKRMFGRRYTWQDAKKILMI